MALRVRKRFSTVRHKDTKRVGRIILRDGNNIYVLWENQTPQEINDGPAILARPYQREFLERI